LNQFLVGVEERVSKDTDFSIKKEKKNLATIRAAPVGAQYELKNEAFRR
jgi:hypothetical protein